MENGKTASKERTAANVVIGDQVSGMPLYVKAVLGEGKDCYKVTFADRTGEVLGEIHKELLRDSVSNIVGKGFSCSGYVVTEKGQPKFRIRVLEPIHSGNFAQLCGCIPDDKKSELLHEIEMLIRCVKDLEFSAVLRGVLTDERLEQLSYLPASHAKYGTFLGAALVETVAVSHMAGNAHKAYCSFAGVKPVYDLLLTSALLRKAAMPEYCDSADPTKRSVYGTIASYSGALDALIYTVVERDSISISREKLALLLNTIHGSYAGSRVGCTKESAVLQSIVTAYTALANIEVEQGDLIGTDSEYKYSRSGRSFVLRDDVQENIYSNDPVLPDVKGA